MPRASASAAATRRCRRTATHDLAAAGYPERRAADLQVGLHAELRDRLEEHLRATAEDRDQRLLHQVERHPAERLRRRRLRPAVHRQPRHGGRQGLRPAGGDAVRPVAFDLAAGYTNARYTKNSPSDAQAQPLAARRRCHLRPGGHQQRPGRDSAVDGRRGAGVQLPHRAARCLRAARLGVSEPQPLAGCAAGPEQQRDLQLRPLYTLPPRPSPRCAAG